MFYSYDNIVFWDSIWNVDEWVKHIVNVTPGPKLYRRPLWWRSYVSWTYNYLCNQCLSPLKLPVRITLRRGVLDTTWCDKVCQWHAAGQWFSPVSSTTKTDHQDITEISLKVTLIIIALTHKLYHNLLTYYNHTNCFCFVLLLFLFLFCTVLVFVLYSCFVPYLSCFLLCIILFSYCCFYFVLLLSLFRTVVFLLSTVVVFVLYYCCICFVLLFSWLVLLLFLFCSIVVFVSYCCFLA